MCSNLLKDSRTFEFLLQIDQDTETQAGKEVCRFCGDRLHRAFYERKPRAPGLELSTAFATRPSYCCRRDGCRRRMTPALIRFLGRKVYVSVLVALVAAMTQGPNPKRLCALKTELGIPPRTVHRWLEYWRNIFVLKDSWRYHCGNFMPPVDESGLPYSLLERFHQSTGDSLQAALRLLHLAIDCPFKEDPKS